MICFDLGCKTTNYAIFFWRVLVEGLSRKKWENQILTVVVGAFQTDTQFLFRSLKKQANQFPSVTSLWGIWPSPGFVMNVPLNIAHHASCIVHHASWIDRSCMHHSYMQHASSTSLRVVQQGSLFYQPKQCIVDFYCLIRLKWVLCGGFNPFEKS